MSVVRPKPPEDPILYDPAAVFATGGLGGSDLAALHGRLDAARGAALDDCGRAARGEAGDAGFIDLPERLLAAYHSARPASELFAILGTARRLREAVDRIVVLGTGGLTAGPRVLFESCCHPFHNELDRGERGGRPRLAFEGFTFDNDTTQGLLDLLESGARAAGGDDLLGRWALVVAGVGGGALETAAATRLFLRSLLASVGGDPGRLAHLVVPITHGSTGPSGLGRALAVRDSFGIPAGVGGRFSVFTAVGLLPAATVGIDVVRLLEGAAAMNRRFREAPAAENPVLRFAGVSHLARERLGATGRALAAWSPRLAAVALWYDHLLPESLDTPCGWASPPALAAARDLHAGGGRQPDGPCDALVTNLLVGEPRRDRLTVPPLGAFTAHEDGLGDLVGRAWPELLAAAVAGASEAAARGGRPTADLVLPRVDEHTVGQLLQLLMLAAVVEARLAGGDPSGHSGAESLQSLIMRRLRP